MNKMSLLGSSAGAHRRASRVSHLFSRNAGLTSIRFATVLGCLFAFALLCMLSIRANAAPLVDSMPRALQVDDSRLAVALPARDPVGQLGQPASDRDSREDIVADASLKLAPTDSSDSASQPATGAHDAAIE